MKKKMNHKKSKRGIIQTIPTKNYVKKHLYNCFYWADFSQKDAYYSHGIRNCRNFLLLYYSCKYTQHCVFSTYV